MKRFEELLPYLLGPGYQTERPGVGLILSTCYPLSGRGKKHDQVSTGSGGGSNYGR